MSRSFKQTSLWLVTILAFFQFAPLQAADLTAFNKRFEFVRDEQGALRLIRDNSMTTRLSIRPYIEMLRNRLVLEQKIMTRKGNYDQSIKDLFAEDTAFDQKEFFAEPNVQNKRIRLNRRERNERMVLRSLKKLGELDIEGIFGNPEFRDVISKFETRLSESLELLDLRVVAHVKDSTFFYKRAVGHQAVSWAINYAKKRLSSVPILNTLSYALVQIEQMVRENRTFRQNMLMHYLENVPATELGITHEEANAVFSSIYESRVEWFNVWESRRIQRDWELYGTNKFFTNIRMANTMMRNTDLRGGVLGDRLNYAFQDAVIDGERVIYNLFHTDHQFTSSPALAYNYDRPNFVKRKRIVVKLAELGVSFLTLPNWIKSTADGFLKSLYKEQELTEGALFGHFESQNDQEGMDLVKRQFFNPFAHL